MKRIAKFEKVSEARFAEDWLDVVRAMRENGMSFQRMSFQTEETLQGKAARPVSGSCGPENAHGILGAADVLPSGECEASGEAEDEAAARAVYERIQLPKRATVGSAGYDFFSTLDVVLAPGESVKIPTGIRVRMEEDYVLFCFPRSGLGFKFRLQLDNTVGVIDSDYFYSKNEGHIFIKVTNDSKAGKSVSLKKGEAFAQGVFVQYGITEDDDTDGVRDGGLGSTTNRTDKE